MASLSPQDCCFRGVTHDGEAKGDCISFAEVEAYVTYPESKATYNAILILTDVFGHRLINTQLIADQFAANGFFVVVPDLFDGDAVPAEKPADLDINSWFQGTYHPKGAKHTPDVIDKIVESVIGEMKDNYGVKNLGAIGYCIGAKYVVRQLNSAGHQQKIDAGFANHPTDVETEELAAVAGPLAIAAAQHDWIFPAEKRHESELMLEQLGVPFQVTLYGGVPHGFAVRGDMSDPQVVYAKESAFLQAVQWFDSHLRKKD